MRFYVCIFEQMCIFVHIHFDMIKEKLRKIRTDKGFSQKQIAAILPTDVSNYNRKELGLVKINKQEWDKIAKFLEVPLDEIYEAEPEKKTSVKYKNPIFNDSSTGIGVQYVEIMPSIVENLQDLIQILKIDNENLRLENQKLKEENSLLKNKQKNF